MTEQTPDPNPVAYLDPSTAAWLAAAENHLASHHPLLTTDAQAAMLARIRQAALAADPDPAPVTPTAAAAGIGTAAAGFGGSAAVSSHIGGSVQVLTLRRASAFAQALEVAGQDPHGQEDDERRRERAGEELEQFRLLSLANTLGSLPRPELDPDVKTVQRADLVAVMEQAVLGGPTADAVSTQPARRQNARGRVREPDKDRRASPRPRARFARSLAALGLAVGLAAGGMSGLAATSTNALPGDALYGVKVSIEDWRLDMAEGDTERGALRLGFATTRLTELQELQERAARDNTRAERDKSIAPGTYTDDLRRALLGLLRDTTAGQELLVDVYRKNGSQQPIEVLSSFSDAHHKDWTHVRERLPTRLNGMADKVTAAFDSIERATTALREQPVHATSPSPAQPSGALEPGENPDSTTHRAAKV